MENKNSVNIKAAEFIKDRGDNLKKARVTKKDLEKIKDSGDSASKSISEKVIYSKSTEHEETLDIHSERSKYVVNNIGNKAKIQTTHEEEAKADKNSNKFKSFKHNKAISKSSYKPVPANLASDEFSKFNSAKDSKYSKQSEVINNSLGRTDPRNTKENNETRTTKENNVIYSSKLANVIHNSTPKITKIKNIVKDYKHNEIPGNNNFNKPRPGKIHENEAMIKPSDIPAPLELVNNKCIEKKYIKDDEGVKRPFGGKTAFKNTKQNEEVVIYPSNPDKVTNRSTVYKYKTTVSKDDKQRDKNGIYDSDIISVKKPEHTKTNIEKYEKRPAVFERIVESEKLVNRQLNIDEKERIKEKNTLKSKAKGKDTQVKDCNDILKKPSNLDESKENMNDKTKIENTKHDIGLKSEEKTRKYPIIRTVVAKHDATKVYKAVTFAEQKRKTNTPLHIKIPVLLNNNPLPNDAAVMSEMKSHSILANENDISKENTKISNVLANREKKSINTMVHTQRDNLDKNSKVAKLLCNIATQRNEGNFAKNIKSPKMSPKRMLSGKVDEFLRNIKTSYKNNKVQKSTKVSTNNVTTQSKITKLLSISASCKRNKETAKMSRSTESRSSAKTKSSKKGRRNRLKSDLSLFSFGTDVGRGSPATEVAKWAPSCINKHTQPYYEAWVDTTLAAVSKHTEKDKLYYENRDLVKSFERILEQQNEIPELMYEKSLDERYIGKIKIKQK